MGSQKKIPDHIRKNPLESSAAALRIMSIPAINVSMNDQSARGAFGWKNGPPKGAAIIGPDIAIAGGSYIGPYWGPWTETLLGQPLLPGAKPRLDGTGLSVGEPRSVTPQPKQIAVPSGM